VQRIIGKMCEAYSNPKEIKGLPARDARFSGVTKNCAGGDTAPQGVMSLRG